MKRILLIVFLIFTMLCNVSGQDAIIEITRGKSDVSCISKSFNGFNANFSFNSIKSFNLNTEKGVFSSLVIDGAYNSGNIGSPELPVFQKMIYIPDGTSPVVTISGYDEYIYKLDDYKINTVSPVQPSYSKSEKAENVKFVYDESKYKAGYENRSIAKVEILGSMRGVTIGKLYVYPVDYNSIEGTVKVFNNINVDVTFENADLNRSKSLTQKTYSPYFKPVYDNLFNVNMIERVTPPWGDLTNYPVKMLVIANRMFESALQPFIEWKTLKGFEVDVNYTDVIGNTASAIKTFCQQKYNSGNEAGNPPTFLVIVGDIQQVPASARGSESGKQTDLYYGSTDGDMFPDMYYSRISVINAAQLTAYINKMLYYEKYQFEDDSYLNNATLIAGWDSYWNGVVGVPTTQYWINNYFNASHGFNTINYWSGKPYGQCYANINNGVSIVNYTAHGSEDSWSEPYFDVDDVHALSNTNKYTVAIGNCCLSGDFGTSECFGEAWIRAENKGAVGYIGSSPSSYWYEDYYWSVGAFPYTENKIPPTVEGSGVGVYDGFFSGSYNTLCAMVLCGNMAVTEAHDNNYSSSVSDLYYWQSYNVLGDGSIAPYLTVGKTNSVSHMPLIYLGFNTYGVTAEPGSYIAISKNGELYGTALTDELGSATVQLKKPITELGEVDLVVTKAKYKPYFAKLPAQSADKPYISFKKCILANGSESLIYGQESALTLEFENLGDKSTSNNVEITISCDDPFLTILDNSEVYSKFDSKEVKSVTDGFRVKVSKEVENNYKFNINFTAKSGDDTWEGKFRINAVKPVLEFSSYYVEGELPTKGEINYIELTFSNNGGYKTTDGKVSLTCNSDYIYLLNNELPEIDKIEAGGNEKVSFAFFADPSLPIEHIAKFSTKFVTSDGIETSADFELVWTGYCIPTDVSCANKDNIVDFIFAGIENTGTGCSDKAYGDYTDMVATVEPGNTYTASVKAGYGGDKISIWIDFDSNGIFAENELVVKNINCITANKIFTADVVIPANVTPGDKRMRVRALWSQNNEFNPDPCHDEIARYGETEDYTVTVSTPFVKPDNLVITQDNANVVLKWNTPKDVVPDGYLVYRGDDLLTSEKISANTFEDKKINAGIYVYKVVAVYGDNQSVPTIGLIDVSGACYPVVDLTGECTTPRCVGGSIELQWTNPYDDNYEGDYSFNIYRNDELIDNVKNATKFISNDEPASVTNIYNVTTLCEFGESEKSNSLEIFVHPTIGVENLNNYDIRIYPNPAGDFINIESENAVSVTIFDLSGKMIINYEINNSNPKIDVSKIKNGAYLMVVKMENDISVNRNIIIKH